MACAAVFAGVEECEEAVGAWIGRQRGRAVAPGAEAFVCCFEVGGFEEVCLCFPGFCGEDEVIWDDGEFVQDKGVRWILWGEACEEQV